MKIQKHNKDAGIKMGIRQPNAGAVMESFGQLVIFFYLLLVLRS